MQEQKSFIIGSPLGQGPSASTNEALEDAIYGLNQGDVTKTPLKVGDNWYVVGVTKREDASMEDFAKQRDSLREQMLNQKRGEIFSEYVASTRRRMENDGSIKVYQDVVEKIDGPPESGLPPGMPAGFPRWWNAGRTGPDPDTSGWRAERAVGPFGIWDCGFIKSKRRRIFSGAFFICVLSSFLCAFA